MKKEQGIGIKMKSDNGQVLTVAFRPKTKDWWVSVRKGHKGTERIILSQAAIQKIGEMLDITSTSEKVYPLLDLSRNDVSWKQVMPKNNAPQ